MAMLLLTTVLFCSLNAKLTTALGWIPRTQILPLSLATTFTTLIVWVVITLIFGRIYCSTVCPMAAVQDIFARLPRVKPGWKHRRPYHYAAPLNLLRYISLALIAFYILMGLYEIPRFLDPATAYHSICDNLFSPVVSWIGGTDVVIGSLVSFVLSVVTLLAVGYFSWRHGRIICNTLCPVGNTLSLISRWSLFHFDIDTDLCTNCRRCEEVCKAQCISLTDHVVDSSRCVACFNCTAACRDGAIRYTTRRKQLSIPMMTTVKKLSPNATISRPAKTYSGKRN
jgi:polyferredoxin